MKKEFPLQKIHWGKDLGVSIVAIGLGIGSGEFILWPFLSSSYGYGILWIALVGITFQVLINVEMQRYAAVTAESPAKGFLKLHKGFSFWFVFSTLVGFGWPAFAASSAYLLSHASGFPDARVPLSIAMLAAAAMVLVVNEKAYERIERILKVVVPLSFLLILGLFIHYFDWESVKVLLRGFVGIGEGFIGIPSAVDIVLLLSAFAYAGSGGNLLLGQGYYVLAKKQGMAAYNTKPELLDTNRGYQAFKKLRFFHIFESTAIFGGIGLVTIAMLSYLAPRILGVDHGLTHSLAFLVTQARYISTDIGQVWGILFLLSGGLALLSVQLGVLDTMGRVIADAFSQKPGGFAYRLSVLIQSGIGVGLFLLGLTEPLWLVSTGAVANALAMSVLALGVRKLNTLYLPKRYAISSFHSAVLLAVGIIYALFFLLVMLRTLGLL